MKLLTAFAVLSLGTSVLAVGNSTGSETNTTATTTTTTTTKTTTTTTTTTRRNPCSSNPCNPIRSTCEVVGLAGYVCRCSPGYSGPDRLVATNGTGCEKTTLSANNGTVRISTPVGGDVLFALGDGTEAFTISTLKADVVATAKDLVGMKSDLNQARTDLQAIDARTGDATTEIKQSVFQESERAQAKEAALTEVSVRLFT